jgi:hypothetical protein
MESENSDHEASETEDSVEDTEAVMQERDVAAEPDVETVDEAQDEEPEEEIEVESEDRESEKIEEREEEKESEHKKSKRRKRGVRK